MPALGDYVTFHDPALARRYVRRRMPIAKLCEAYFEGKLDFHRPIAEFLQARADHVSYELTWEHLKWATTRYLPAAVARSRGREAANVQAQYDRGDDFFRWFLGDSMAYTCGFFDDPSMTLEQAQERSIDRVLEKLALQPGERLLDVGCGWGTLVARAAEHWGADVTGVTISRNQADFADAQLAERGLSKRARILCQDYRDVAGRGFDKVVCLEMVEHVGVRNLGTFYRKMSELLSNRGLFLLQWTGLRSHPRPEELMFGLFMEMHVAPGADAGLCQSAMMQRIEHAGFHTKSVENLSGHYLLTVERWYRNWLYNRDAVLARYGERAFRVWHFFLAWASVILEQGSAACHQVLLFGDTNPVGDQAFDPRVLTASESVTHH